MKPDTRDRGASLVMALVFLLVGSLIAISLTTFSSTNFLTTSSNRTLRITNYGADGAMEAAIQQVRYHGGACDKSFPKSGSLSLYPHDVANTEYVYVTCTATPLSLITAAATIGQTTLTSPSSPFSSLYATTGQPVENSGGTVIGHITSVSSDHSTATMSPAAPFTGTVYVGQDGQSFDTFYSCVSSSPITSCSSTSPPAITTTVLFQNANVSGSCGSQATATGCRATVESWTVRDANG
jgi:hypothetical protein